MDLTVRRAVETDIPSIMELLLQVDMIHHAGRPDIFKGPATKYTEHELRAILNDSSTPVFVCVNAGEKVLGHAFCIEKQITDDNVLTDIRTLYVDDICVDESARGRHVGKTLFEHVKAYAKDNGCYNLTLNVWTCNEAAMRFYEAMGMKPQKICMETIL